MAGDTMYPQQREERLRHCTAPLALAELQRTASSGRALRETEHFGSLRMDTRHDLNKELLEYAGYDGISHPPASAARQVDPSGRVNRYRWIPGLIIIKSHESTPGKTDIIPPSYRGIDHGIHPYSVSVILGASPAKSPMIHPEKRAEWLTTDGYPA